ncbi:hypothetical protein B484DRAFT_420711, partial [Ochromonadaceae sp. CCMP2298]
MGVGVGGADPLVGDSADSQSDKEDEERKERKGKKGKKGGEKGGERGERGEEGISQSAFSPPTLSPLSPLMRVDSAAVLCSAALCSLAEVPQCRPSLVSSGALKQIRLWLEVGVEVLEQARVCNSPHRGASGGQSLKHWGATVREGGWGGVGSEGGDTHTMEIEGGSCWAFMRTFSPAYELISNAAAALMHLCGG